MTFSIVKRWKNASEAVKLFLTVLIGGAILGLVLTFTAYAVWVAAWLIALGVAILLVWVFLYLAWEVLKLILLMFGSLFD